MSTESTTGGQDLRGTDDRVRELARRILLAVRQRTVAPTLPQRGAGGAEPDGNTDRTAADVSTDTTAPSTALAHHIDPAVLLRRAVTESQLTRHRLAKRTGLSYAVVHRFMAGRDIQLSTASKIAAALGAEFHLRPRP